MIPVLYNKDEQQFRTYGLGEISDIINPKVTRERNGQYILYFQYPQNAEFSDIFEEDMRIKSDAGVRTKWQTFEISRVIRKEGQLIEVFAKHISQSLLKDALNPSVNILNSDAQQALNAWNNSRIGGEDFDVWSDITTTNSTSWNIREVSNAFEALAGVQGSILDVWGGEYEFDNKMIRLHKEMGRKSPVPLEYGRNITGLEQDRQEDNIYTSIYPFAVYTPEEAEEPETVTLPEYYVDGKYLDMYPKRKIRVVDFSAEFEYDDIPTADRLRVLANQYIETNEIGLPHENLKVSYIDLSKTLDYREFQTMEEVELNDILPIFYPKFGITNENAKVVAVNYDPIKEENISIELGVIGQSFRAVTAGGIGSRLDKIEKQQDVANNYILNNKGNRIWFEAPNENMEHKIGDTWFEKNGLYDRIKVWNGSQWEMIIDTEDIDKNAKEIEDVRQAADEAVSQIDTAVENAGFASLSDSLTGIQSISNTAQANAQTALSNALSAIDDASLAKTNAQTAINRATHLAGQVSDFELTVDGFNQTINNYKGQVSSLINDISGFESTVANYEIELDEYGNEVGRYATQVSTLENTVNGFRSSVDKVEKDYQGISGTVATHSSSISNLDGEIALKANTTTVNALTGRVSAAETGITSNANAIKLKASQSSVDTLTGKVNSLGAQIDVTAGQISSKVWNTDIETAVDNIEVGGRNLLRNSEREVNAVGGREFVQYADLAPVFEEHGLDEVYSLSLDLKSADTSERSRIQVYMQNGSGTRYVFVNSSVSVTEEYQRFKFEGLTPILGNATEVRAMLAFYGFYDTGNFPIIRRVKLEKGNKATDWTPAPEDTAEAISHVESEITQTRNMIDLRTTNDASGNVTSITLTDGSIISRVNNNKIHLTDQYFYGGSKFITDHIEAVYAEMDNLRVNNTIDASKVRVINLDALNITANKTSFVKSVWNSLSSVVEIQSTGLKMKTSQGWDAYLGASGLEFRAGLTPISTLRASLGADGRPEGAVLVAEPGYHSGLGYRRHDDELRFMVDVDTSRSTSTSTDVRLRLHTDTIHTDYNSFMVRFTNVGRYFYAAPGTLDGMDGIYIGANLPYAKGHAGSTFYSITGGTYALAADKNSYKRLN